MDPDPFTLSFSGESPVLETIGLAGQRELNKKRR
jgi:hypothetical protein